MKNKIIKSILIIMIVVVIAVIGGTLFAFLGSTEYKNYKQQQEELQKMQDEMQDKCEHDWVVTSRYNHNHGQYYTFSKCTKCGKEAF